MSRSIDRRAFLRRAATAAAVLTATPLLGPPAARGQGDRLVVAVGQWGTETPFAWRHVQAEKPLWDCVYDPLIMRDPKTFEYRPGLATEWKPSNEMRTWTFKLRPGVKFHEGCGELTAEDVKFTVEQNLKPDALGGSAHFFRNHLDRIETPDKLTVVMHFKNRASGSCPRSSRQFVGYQNIISKKYFETRGRGEGRRSTRSAPARIRHVEGKQGDYHRFEAVRQPLAQDAGLQGAGHPPHPGAGHAAGRPARGRDRHRPGLRRLPRAGAEGRAAHPRVAERRPVLGDPDRPDDARPRGLLPDLPVGRRPQGPEEPGERRARCGWR